MGLNYGNQSKRTVTPFAAEYALTWEMEGG